MELFSNILGIISNGLKITAGWMDKYASKENITARQISNENSEQDKLHKDLKNKDLDAVRRDLN